MVFQILATLIALEEVVENNSRNEQGVALLLVIGVIAVLSFVLFEFTFETKLNKLKVYNQEDRFQARLNAEAGLNFAMGKLRLYQEGRNLIEKNDSIKASFSSGDLEDIILQPFMYPIPLSAKASIIQKNALKEFEKNTILRGEMSVTFNKISGLLNPNSLRLIDEKQTTQAQKDQAAQDGAGEDEDQTGQAQADQSGDDKNKSTSAKKLEATKNIFLKYMTQAIDDKLKSDEDFHNKHANTSVQLLIDELAFYVNDASKVNGQEFAEAKNKFSQKNINAKHAPMASLDELYLLPSWDDSLVEMFKDRMSVNELTAIPVNEITNADIKIIFPDINDMQIEEFFKYREGDPDKKIKPQPFKNADDFKNVVTSKLNIISEPEYNKRMDTLKAAGLTIDTAGKLYKVTSKGVFNNANYTIVAIVDLPVKEPPKTTTKTTTKSGQQTNPDSQQTESTTSTEGQTEGSDPKKKAAPTELLQPRVVQIRAE